MSEGVRTVDDQEKDGKGGELLPVVGELDDDLLAAISGGQAVVLTTCGQPAAVVIDLDTYAEWAEASGLAP